MFYDQLPRGGIFKSAPVVWVCGDLHLENFGSYRADNGLAYFDINDFDESALAPATWDLVRLLTSVLIGAEEFGFKPSTSQRLCRVFLESYCAALAAGKAYWVERDTATGLVHQLLDSVRDRKRPEFLDSRTSVHDGKRRLRTDGEKAFPAEKRERAMVRDFMRDLAKTQSDPDFYRMVDVARRIAGTGSLGVERYVVLVRGKGSPDGNYLLDLKASVPSALTTRLKTPQPRWKTQAHRIVGVQQRYQAAEVEFLQPVLMDERPFVLRALQPAQDRIELDRASADQLEGLIGTMGRIVAWAQLRSAGRGGSAIADELIAFGNLKRWKNELLDAAIACARQVRKDAKTFAAAWDDGAFKTPQVER